MTMKTANSQQPDTTDDIIIVIITLISILITEFISCFTPSLKKSPQPLATNLSPQKKVRNNTQPKLTSKTRPKVQSPAPETSSETNEESFAATGFQPVATTRQRRRTNSQAGTTYPASKTLKNGHSTASVLPQVTTK